MLVAKVRYVKEKLKANEVLEMNNWRRIDRVRF